MEKNRIVSEKVKSVRESKNISREELSERSGLSLEQIARIEENVDLPALATLLKIARALGVRLGTFLDDQENIGPVVCRKNESASCISFSTNAPDARKHMDYYSLSKSKSNRHMEPFIINIAPAEKAAELLSSHEGEEFIWVMDGKVEINYGNDTYQLETGDSIYYDSIVPHYVHASKDCTAKILAVVYTPI